MSTHSYNYVCFHCRTVSRLFGKCQSCQRHLINAGDRWRFPKKTDNRGWKTLIKTMKSSNDYWLHVLEDSGV